ncbi:hypothetical protein [Nitratireductor sp. CH_MIT9313-5]|uniref:hypothetical protein n=1 Tax=Nitratireductor sp. CH_MIT9313-5 TaxID=3107764 RepID=UPI0030081E2D
MGNEFPDYVCVDDGKGAWSVIDTQTGQVAQIDNNPLQDLPWERADVVRRTLSQIRRTGRDRTFGRSPKAKRDS